jgi:hypothetical protein
MTNAEYWDCMKVLCESMPAAQPRPTAAAPPKPRATAKPAIATVRPKAAEPRKRTREELMRQWNEAIAIHAKANPKLNRQQVVMAVAKANPKLREAVVEASNPSTYA